MPNTGASAGTGAAIGGAIGSVIPGIGTVIGAGVGAAAGWLGSLWAGNKKRKYGKQQLAEAERNKPQPITYTIPSSVQEAVRMYQGLSQEGLPGEDVIRDQMGAAYAGASGDITRTAESGVGALGAMTGLYGKFMNSVRDLGVQSAQVKAQNEQNYILQNAQAKMQLGDYQDRAWDVNVNQPFQRGMNEYWGNKQAGMANLWGGIDQMVGGTVDFAGNMQSQNQFNQLMSLYGGGGGGNPAKPALSSGYVPSPVTTMPIAPSVYSGVPQIPMTGNSAFGSYSWGGGRL